MTLPVAVFLKWSISRQDELDWGAAGSCEFIQWSWSLKPISKLKYTQAQCLFIEYWSAIEKLGAWMWWILFWGLAERNPPATPQSNSSCLEIDQFGEMATGRANFGHLFYQNLKKSFLKESSGTIRIRMQCFIIILWMFELCHLDVPDRYMHRQLICQKSFQLI